MHTYRLHRWLMAGLWILPVEPSGATASNTVTVTRQVATSRAIVLACSWTLATAPFGSSGIRNGAQHGPGYAAGSGTGPVCIVATLQMINHNESAQLLPNAQQPEQTISRGVVVISDLSIASKGAKNQNAGTLFLATQGHETQGTRVAVC
jgi:hypothetical protein